MKKKFMMLFLCMMVSLSACGKSENGKNVENDINTNVAEDNKTIETVQLSDEKLPEAENMHTEDVADIEEKNEVESIQEEIAKVEVKSCEYENADWSSMGQQEMNLLTEEWYRLWDDELNSLWSRLSDELDAEKKAKVLDEQRAWIKRKEANVKAAGAMAFGGSLQPQLENSTAEEMTRARAYILAGCLAEVRNESFIIPPEIQESIDMADPSLDDVFGKFEGQWIFDEERGACVGIERTETCAYGVEGSNWTVWVTGGDIISDLDVYGYTENCIVFKVAHEDYDAFYMLTFNVAGSIYFEYGTSLDAMDEVISATGTNASFPDAYDTENMSVEKEITSSTGSEADFEGKISLEEYESFSAVTDANDAKGYNKFDDFADVLNQDFIGTWYNPELGEAIRLTDECAYVYIPYLDEYGDTPYEWELIDRSDKKLCPELAIYISGKGAGPLAYYVAGFREEYFWCNSQMQIFHRQ